MLRVLGVDPGTANTGLCVIENGVIVRTKTIVTKPTSKAKAEPFQDVIERSYRIAHEILLLVGVHGPFDRICVESYEDMGSYLRNASRRWMTPVTIAIIHAVLAEAGIPVTFQSPSIVMRAYADIVNCWRAGQVGIFPGDTFITNDHQRSAAAHALFGYKVAKIEVTRHAVN